MTTPLEYMEKWTGKLYYRQQLGSYDSKIKAIRRPDPDVKDKEGRQWADCTSSIQHAFLKSTNDSVNPGYYTGDMRTRGTRVADSTRGNFSDIKTNDILLMRWNAGYWHAELAVNNSTCIGHGGPGKGPTRKNIRALLGKAAYWEARRHKLPTTTKNNTATPAKGKKKVSDKTTYQDYRARNGGLVLKPGVSRSLSQSKTATAASAANITRGSAGLFLTNAHVYAKGEPGDVLNLYFLRSDRSKSPIKNYVQYYESVTIDKRGLARVNLSNVLTRKNTKQWFFARVLASSSNAKGVTVTVLDADVVQL